MGVNVERDPADKPGDHIIEPSLTNREAQIERGRNEIEKTSCNKKVKTSTMLTGQYYQSGSLHEIINEKETVRGLVTGFSLQYSVSKNGTNCSVQTTFEVPVCEK